MRRRRYAPEAGKGWERGATEFDCEDASTPLHEERLDVVARVLVDSGATSVLDLGCGSGALLRRLLDEPQFTRIVGIDSSLAALTHAERLRGSEAGGEPDRLSILHGSFTTSSEGLTGFDAVALVETIEHVPPAQLSKVEQVVFSGMRPSLVVLTTPNREYNELYGLKPGELRHPDHRFEWDRARFRSWAGGVAARNGYQVQLEPIGPANAWHGGPSQMAIFRRAG